MFTAAFLTFLGLYAPAGRTAAFISAGAVFAGIYALGLLSIIADRRRDRAATEDVTRIAVLVAMLADAKVSDAELLRRIERARVLAAAIRDGGLAPGFAVPGRRVGPSETEAQGHRSSHGADA